MSYTVGIVSAVQQSESVLFVFIFVYMFIFIFRFCFHLSNYKALGRVSCAIQQVLTSYLFYIQLVLLIMNIYNL